MQWLAPGRPSLSTTADSGQEGRSRCRRSMSPCRNEVERHTWRFAAFLVSSETQGGVISESPVAAANLPVSFPHSPVSRRRICRWQGPSFGATAGRGNNPSTDREENAKRHHREAEEGKDPSVERRTAMASKTKQQKRRDPSKEIPKPRCGDEQPLTMEACCCDTMMSRSPARAGIPDKVPHSEPWGVYSPELCWLAVSASELGTASSVCRPSWTAVLSSGEAVGNVSRSLRTHNSTST